MIGSRHDLSFANQVPRGGPGRPAGQLLASAHDIAGSDRVTCTDASSFAPRSAADLGGRWTGVEGMILDVAPGATPGAYRLTMQYDLDHKGSFDATRDGDTLVFERNGKREVLKPTDGYATGLKYLAGKNDCLTVVSGEGYCRD